MNQVLNFRLSSGGKLELIKSFDIQVDRMQIAEPGTPITTIIIIIVIIVLITIILVIMATVYAKNNDKWCYQSSSRPYINPDISVRLHLGVLPPKKTSIFKDIVQKGGREVNPISKK